MIVVRDTLCKPKLKHVRAKTVFLVTSLLLSVATPMQAHASCCSFAVAAIGAAATLINAQITLINIALIDPLTGKSVARILRDTQGTNSLESLKVINGIQDGLEAHKNSMITYHQQSEFANIAQITLKEFPNIPSDACVQWQLANSSTNARVDVLQAKAIGSSSGKKRSESMDSPKTIIEEYKKRVSDKVDGVAASSGGTLTHPGCTPIFDPKVSMFETKIPVPVGWNCENEQAQTAPKTIPEKNSKAAQYLVNSLVDRDPIPQSRVDDRKTFAGQIYEKNRAIHRATMDLYRDYAQDALAAYLPTRTIETEAKAFFDGRGVTLPKSGVISDMDYLSKQVQARWESPSYLASLYAMPEKNVLIAIQETQNLQNEIMFRILELENKKNLMNSIENARSFDDKVRPELQNARMRTN